MWSRCPKAHPGLFCLVDHRLTQGIGLGRIGWSQDEQFEIGLLNCHALSNSGMPFCDQSPNEADHDCVIGYSQFDTNSLTHIVFGIRSKSLEIDPVPEVNSSRPSADVKPPHHVDVFFALDELDIGEQRRQPPSSRPPLS